MSTYQNRSISKGIDWVTVWLYAFILAVGIMCIFMVEYNSDQPWLSSFLTGQTNYSKQLLFAGICVVVATFILLSDSKLYTAFANLLYAFGILLMLATFVIGKSINGSKSWIPLGGGFNLQPAELCKIFAALALAKYMSRQDIDFTKISSQIVAGAIAMLPAVLSVAQNETGLALVYAAFFIVMYREGLPGWILVVGFSFGALVVATLVLQPLTLFIALTLFAGAVVYFNIKKIKRRLSYLFFIIFVWLTCVGISVFAVPYIFNNVFQCYQSQRIYSMVGKDYDCSQNKAAQTAESENRVVIKPDDYNVRQSKIAIGSGGLFGRGFLKGTQTRGKYVPEQHTDFIFTSLGEAFGFVGCFVFLLIYFFLLLRIVNMAERQRSTFSRVYAYSVASILFLHIAVNVCMTIGLFPIVGIPLPLMSYGGSSLLTFTILIFILIRLDADRNMVLR
ncbi:rod shape-determining protein RodA [Ilyomonas limi]|uniref:Cell wall polymerase n=1 Tax=Ilyomonas limi TaxID=2575867 RepID=A0A4U3L570_9BACT|nr:rod shape-determining protein RodA [Ilyomonas limi]TKK70298.1 rod shape-determining protein RodA [Ilyomonas limi]